MPDAPLLDTCIVLCIYIIYVIMSTTFIIYINMITSVEPLILILNLMLVFNMQCVLSIKSLGLRLGIC